MSIKPLETADVLIVCSLPLEAEPLIQSLRERQEVIGHRFVVDQGKLRGKRVAIVRVGVKPARIRSVLHAVFDVHQPRCVYAVGLGVGLVSGIEVGGVIVASEVTVTSDDRSVRPDATLFGTAVAMSLRPARLITTDNWPRRAIAKQRLAGGQPPWEVADRATHPIAGFCVERRLPWVSIRVVVEDVATDSPPESLAVYEQEPGFRRGATVGAALRGVSRLGTIWRIRRATEKHSRELARRVIATLPVCS